MPNDGTLTFETEEAKAAAIEEFPEDSEDMGELDRIMAAEITSAGEGETKVEPEPEPEPEPETPAEEAKVSDDDLKGHKTRGELLKAYDEKVALIERQSKFIKDNVGGAESGNQTLLKRLEAAEARTADLEKQVKSGPVNEKPTDSTQKKIEVSESRVEQIKAMQAELESADDPYDEEVVKKQRKLTSMLLDEVVNLNGLVSNAHQEIALAREEGTSAKAEVGKLLKRDEEAELTAKIAAAQDADFSDANGFKDKFKEFQFSVDPKTSQPKAMGAVDAEYTKWAEDVASLYYKQPISFSNNRDAALRALKMLESESPDLVEMCRVAGVPTDPSDDIVKYLDICDLMDYRDGIRLDPNTGKSNRVMRFDAALGKEVPVIMESIEQAFEYRRVKDGHYKKLIAEKYSQGGKDMAEAIRKRDSGVEELDNTTGVSQRDAGLEMSVEDAMRVAESIDERDAMILAQQGDTSLIDRLNAAETILIAAKAQ